MKKNILILFWFLFFCFYNNLLFSQKNIQTNNQCSIDASSKKTKFNSPTSVIIGTTTYDLQSNASMPRKILTYPNGKISVVWTGSSESSSWTDRGTRYNHFNGAVWGPMPTSKIESKRVGWGTLTNTNSGEIVVSHLNAVTKNSGVGTTFGITRNAAEFWNLTWPRTSSVHDTIYAIIGTSASDPLTGFLAPVYYGRSTNGGLSFDTVKADFAISAGYDTVHHLGNVGGDSYAIDAYKNYVAILLLGATEDVILLKSNNYGVTWSKKIIRKFALKKYTSGILPDTIGVTGSGSVIIDKLGVVHIAFCDTKVSDPTGAGLNFDLIAKSKYINYWNDLDTLVRKVNTLVDLNGNGKIDYGRNFTGVSNIVRYNKDGLSLNPMLSVSSINPNRVILTFAAVKDGDTTSAGVPFRNIYTMSTTNKGISWSTITDISQTTGVENMFVSSPREILSDGYLHLTWQQDLDPGNAVQGAHPSTVANIIYDKIFIESNPIPNVLKVGYLINKTTQCLTANSFVFTDTSNVKLGQLVPSDSIVLRTWSFGDGTFSILKNPIKSYLNPGTYSVKLKIITAIGIVDSIIKTVIITPGLNTAIISGNVDYVFANKNYNYSISNSSGVVYNWAIANGKIVSGQGTNNIVVKWKYGNNIGVVRCNRTLGSCTDFVIDTLNVLSNFISNNQEFCGPSSTNILNGNQVSIPNLNYLWIKSTTDSTNNYSVIVNSNTKDFLPSLQSQTIWYRRVVSFGSYIDTSNAIYIKINAKPISIIDTLSNLTQCRIGNSFKFHDNSFLNTGSIVSRVWDFGDNTTSTLINPEKSYSNSGVYQVSLVIESDLGCKDTSTVFVKVSQLPTPRFNISRISQCLLFNKFEFVNSSTVSGGVIKSTYWDFGDGTFTSTTNAFKSYALAGNYIVKLIVTTNLGCVDSITKTVTVLQSPSAGKIAGAYDNLTKNTPYLYNVNQQLNHTYNWEIQNGAIVSGQGTNAVTVQWLDNGIGKLNCILTNTINCVDTAKLSVNIGFIGVENYRKTKLNIHPNPTTQSIHIDGLSNDMYNSAMIYSIQGKLLKSIPTIENAEIDLSDFNPGIYLIKINDVAHRVVKL